MKAVPWERSLDVSAAKSDPLESSAQSQRPQSLLNIRHPASDDSPKLDMKQSGPATHSVQSGVGVGAARPKRTRLSRDV